MFNCQISNCLKTFTIYLYSLVIIRRPSTTKSSKFFQRFLTYIFKLGFGAAGHRITKSICSRKICLPISDAAPPYIFNGRNFIILGVGQQKKSNRIKSYPTKVREWLAAQARISIHLYYIWMTKARPKQFL